jgi:choline dehydrogenase
LFNRHTAADLLEYADPKKISVYLHATVQKILFKYNKGMYLRMPHY